jgi:cold shock CspA family protein
MEAHGAATSKAGRMNGSLLWFNEKNATGVIVADDGERLRVAGSGFADGRAPVGRCAGTKVTFDVAELPEGRAAVRVVPVLEETGRRARLRRSQHRS